MVISDEMIRTFIKEITQDRVKTAEILAVLVHAGLHSQEHFFNLMPRRVAGLGTSQRVPRQPLCHHARPAVGLLQPRESHGHHRGNPGGRGRLRQASLRSEGRGTQELLRGEQGTVFQPQLARARFPQAAQDCARVFQGRLRQVCHAAVGHQSRDATGVREAQRPLRPVHRGAAEREPAEKPAEKKEQKAVEKKEQKPIEKKEQKPAEKKVPKPAAGPENKKSEKKGVSSSISPLPAGEGTVRDPPPSFLRRWPRT